MTSSSTPSELKNSPALRLKEKLDSEKKQIDGLTSDVLKNHAETLRKLSADALDTTKSVMEKANTEMTSMFLSQQQQLKKSLRLLWIVPVSVLFLCLFLCAATFAWTSHQVDQAAQKVAESESQIRTLTEQFCATPAGKANCIKSSGSPR